MKTIVRTPKTLVIFWILISISGCSAQLAPLYDKAIVDSLTSTNKEIMTLFSSTSSGTTEGTFQDRSANYDKAIGSIDALEIQTKARPMPDSGLVETVNKWLEKREISPITDNEAPSASALGSISKTLVHMRDTDKKQGLKSTEVKAYKNQTSIYMDQAITYESFLQR